MNKNLDSEIQGGITGDGDSRALPAPPLQSREHPVALAGTGAVIRRFNRDTMWFTTGLLGTVIFAALVLAVQERHPKSAVRTDEASQTGGDLLLNANPAALSKVVGLNGKSTDEISSGPATNVDDGFSPEINHSDLHTNARSWSPAHRQDSARVLAWSTRPRDVGDREKPGATPPSSDYRTKNGPKKSQNAEVRLDLSAVVAESLTILSSNDSGAA